VLRENEFSWWGVAGLGSLPLCRAGVLRLARIAGRALRDGRGCGWGGRPLTSFPLWRA
jgi:hypothetical protein